MLNEPPPPEKRPHPLERKPIDETTANPNRVMLHIPISKPYVTYGLLALNIVIFVVGLLIPNLDRQLLLGGANNQILVLREGEYLRLFSAMFLHGGLIHLFFNVYALFIVGTNIEGLFGHVRFTLIYVLGGVTGSLLSVLFNSPQTLSVGASGAVFALFAAELIYLYQHRKLLGPNGREQFKNLLILAGLNFALGIFSSLGLTSMNIDNWGHIGGFIGGVILTWYIGPILMIRQHPQREGAYLAEDINPLAQRYQVISLYSAALLAVLIVATLVSR
ncbi:MAG: rhomboid family intramembrane serine protease [Anaerolineae bacterium]|jgi:rhomboid protease GluP|nr:rhomboid family intramembrane serine protease [Anaerolineae bacterium]